MSTPGLTVLTRATRRKMQRRSVKFPLCGDASPHWQVFLPNLFPGPRQRFEQRLCLTATILSASCRQRIPFLVLASRFQAWAGRIGELRYKSNPSCGPISGRAMLSVTILRSQLSTVLTDET